MISIFWFSRQELGKSINTDEAAALGAVYQAAYLGKGFKVKKFGVREGNVYPINVSLPVCDWLHRERKSDKDVLCAEMKNSMHQKQVLSTTHA